MSTTGGPDATGGTVAPQSELEYTRGTGAFFPSQTSIANSTGLQTAVTSVNGAEGPIQIVADNNSSVGGTITIGTPAPGATSTTIPVSIAVAPFTVSFYASFPPSPLVGELVYYSGGMNPGLYVWDGTSWIPGFT